MRTLRLSLLAAVALAAYGCKKHHEHAGTAVTTSGAEHAGKAHGKEHAGKEHGKEHAGHAHGKEHAGHAHGKEHAGHAHGKEHAGKEHAGKEHAGKEHAGKEHGGSPVKKDVTAQDVKDAMTAHIQNRTKDGVFKIKDEKTGKELELVFVKIHDPVRKIEKKVNLPEGYFACTDFHLKGAPQKVYDLDFWFQQQPDGSLKVTEERIHKHPEQVAGKWDKKARYTFVDDKPVEIQ